jgi:hypothetical protein
MGRIGVYETFIGDKIVTVIGAIQAHGTDRRPFHRAPRFWAWTITVAIGIIGIALDSFIGAILFLPYHSGYSAVFISCTSAAFILGS